MPPPVHDTPPTMQIASDAARGGVTGNNVRYILGVCPYVLGVSLALAVIAGVIHYFIHA